LARSLILFRSRVTKGCFCGALNTWQIKAGGTGMTLSSHLQELRKKHQSLSEQVEQAQRSPAIDALHISDMKKQKLKLKEEISRLTGG